MESIVVNMTHDRIPKTARSSDFASLGESRPSARRWPHARSSMGFRWLVGGWNHCLSSPMRRDDVVEDIGHILRVVRAERVRRPVTTAGGEVHGTHLLVNARCPHAVLSIGPSAPVNKARGVSMVRPMGDPHFASVSVSGPGGHTTGKGIAC
jgi:hypothetical protein